MQWGYDARGQLASATDASGVVTREYRYNDDGLMVWHRLPGGLESEYRWQKFDHWRVVENRTSTGDGCRFSYDLAAGLTTVDHYDGQTRKHYWNAQNLIVRYVDERGENWRYEWDDNELLTRRIDPLGNAVTFVCCVGTSLVRLWKKSMPPGTAVTRSTTRPGRWCVRRTVRAV